MTDADDLLFEEDPDIESGGSEEEVEAMEGAVSTRLNKLKRELEQAKKERQEYMDGWQRSKADYINALKRFEAENTAAKAVGLTNALKTLLPAYDALERSKDHGDVPEGFQSIAKQLEGAFATLGVITLGVVGEKFNPNHHEALGTDQTLDEAKDDEITAVLEKGYAVKEHVLRPARVRVARFEGT